MDTFVWGAVGALAPEIVRWFRIARDRTPSEWSRWSYWLTTVLYMCLAGGFALLVAQPSPYAAFAAGLTTEFSILGLLGTTRRSSVEEIRSRPATPARLMLALLRSHAAYLSRDA